MKKKLLLCSFEPFLTWKTNASTELARYVSSLEQIRKHITHLCLPVCYDRAADMVLQGVAKEKFAAVLCMGHHGRAKNLLIERLALNVAHSSYKDSAGVKKSDELIIPGAPPALWATLPHKELMALAKRRGLPLRLSFHAGTYVCNNVFFLVLHELSKEKSAPPAGFIHVPPIKTTHKGRLSLLSLGDALLAIVTFLLEEEGTRPDREDRN
jgi:pyroglutamyl-peptidase